MHQHIRYQCHIKDYMHNAKVTHQGHANGYQHDVLKHGYLCDVKITGAMSNIIKQLLGDTL